MLVSLVMSGMVPTSGRKPPPAPSTKVATPADMSQKASCPFRAAALPTEEVSPSAGEVWLSAISAERRERASASSALTSLEGLSTLSAVAAAVSASSMLTSACRSGRR